MKITAAMGVCVLLVTLATASPPSDSARAPVQFSEISRREINVGDHKMTLIRVRPPVLPKAPPPPAPPAPTPDQVATEKRLATKAYATLNLTATVYLGKPTVTELRWRDETGESEYVGWSNADFRYLALLPYIETPTTVYGWFPFVYTEALADLPAGAKSPLPKGLKLSARGADYIVNIKVKDLAAQETTLAGLDYLHAYYQLHYAELKAAYEKLQAASDAQEERLRLHPPKAPDTTIRFWIPANK